MHFPLCNCYCKRIETALKDEAMRNCSQMESPSPEAAQSLLMIVITKPDENYQNFTEEVRRYNKKAPFKFPEPNILHQFVKVSSSEHVTNQMYTLNAFHFSLCNTSLPHL